MKYKKPWKGKHGLQLGPNDPIPEPRNEPQRALVNREFVRRVQSERKSLGLQPSSYKTS